MKKRLVLIIEPGDGERLPEELDRAMELAKQLGAHLEALLLTDDQWQRAASLPFAREIGLASAETTQFGLRELEAQIEAARRNLERHLEVAALRNPVHWSLAVRGGELMRQLLDAAESADWLAVAGSSIRGRKRLPRLLFHSPGVRTREVFVLCGPPVHSAADGFTAVLAFGAPNGETVEAARQLALQMEAPSRLALFVPDEVSAPTLSADDVVIRMRAGVWRPDQIIQRVHQIGATAFIAVPSPDCSNDEQKALGAIVAAADFPVAILTQPSG